MSAASGSQRVEESVVAKATESRSLQLAKCVYVLYVCESTVNAAEVIAILIDFKYAVKTV